MAFICTFIGHNPIERGPSFLYWDQSETYITYCKRCGSELSRRTL
jgi:hypothetical protein